VIPGNIRKVREGMNPKPLVHSFIMKYLWASTFFLENPRCGDVLPGMGCRQGNQIAREIFYREFVVF
jgi:hypothetical protein